MCVCACVLHLKILQKTTLFFFLDFSNKKILRHFLFFSRLVTFFTFFSLFHFFTLFNNHFLHFFIFFSFTFFSPFLLLIVSFVFFTFLKLLIFFFFFFGFFSTGNECQHTAHMFFNSDLQSLLRGSVVPAKLLLGTSTQHETPNVLVVVWSGNEARHGLRDHPCIDPHHVLSLLASYTDIIGSPSESSLRAWLWNARLLHMDPRQCMTTTGGSCIVQGIHLGVKPLVH